MVFINILCSFGSEQILVEIIGLAIHPVYDPFGSFLYNFFVITHQHHPGKAHADAQYERQALRNVILRQQVKGPQTIRQEIEQTSGKGHSAQLPESKTLKHAPTSRRRARSSIAPERQSHNRP